MTDRRPPTSAGPEGGVGLGFELTDQRCPAAGQRGVLGDPDDGDAARGGVINSSVDPWSGQARVGPQVAVDQYEGAGNGLVDRALDPVPLDAFAQAG